MSQTTDELLALIRHALWNNTIDEDDIKDDVVDVLDLSRQQTVLGLVLNALERFNVKGDQKTILNYIGLGLNVERQNDVINNSLAEFARFCTDEGLNYIVMKGQTVGSLYPKPNLRMSGDIDFVVPESDILKWREKLPLFASEAVIPSKLKVDEIPFIKDGVLFEFHTCLRSFASRKHQTIWDEFISEEWMVKYIVEIQGQNIRT